MTRAAIPRGIDGQATDRAAGPSAAARFDAVVVVDWSAASKPSPRRPSADAIWTALARPGMPVRTRYHRTRAGAVGWLDALLRAAAAAGERVLIGADFPFGYPSGFAGGLTGRAEALAVWAAFAAGVRDSPDNANNRFDLAAAMNVRFPGTGPFWGRPRGLDCPGLPEGGRARSGHGLPDRRRVEVLLAGAQTCWKLYTTGSVGSQAILGIAALAGLRARHAPRLAVWPFEPVDDAPAVMAEVWPSVLAPQVRAQMDAARASGAAPVKDEVQVALLAATLLAVQARGGLAALLHPPAPAATLAEEGWILGAEAVETLRAACPGPCAFIRET